MACSSIDAGSSSSSGLCEVPTAIFLSHSGQQKPFVESLYEALLKVNHTPFFDKHSLPKASPFPERIITAALNCTLGVVVLSESFVTSKWPMLELEILVQKRGPDARVLPLFYKLKPGDLKSSENLARWDTKWEEMATPEDVRIKWKEALRTLRSLNGETYNEQFMSETQYIEKVVKSILKQVPSPLTYDLSKIIRCDRLAKEIEGQFERLCGARHDERACMVGLHREGGGGKTTICKAMVNFYSSKYRGKSHHLELPTDGSDTEIIVQKCKKALEVLADLDDRYLGKVEDIDQVIRLMKDHLVWHNVFLAIDNVWESSRETAKRILEVGFSSESRILVTSRSQEVLTELFRVQSNSRVGPLPALEYEEAFQIFQEAFELGDLNSLATGRVLIDFVMGRCKFDGTYHALALKSLGVHVKNACPQHHFDDDVVSSILKYIRSADLTEVNAVIKLNYDNLEEHMKYVFLDIVVLPTMQISDMKALLVMRGSDSDGEVTFRRACLLLSALYKNQSPVAMINELCLAGVLQLQILGGSGKTIIKVHDVFRDLARREAESSSRFFISKSSVEKIQWQKIERVIMHRSCKPQFINQLQRQKCCRLQVLDARGVKFLKGIDLRLMPLLCVLKLYNVTLKSVQNWSAAALVIIEFVAVDGANLSMRLNGVAQLQMLRLARCSSVKEIEGLDTLMSLQTLRVRWCSLQRIPDLRSLTQLEILDLCGIELMEEVGGLSPTLRKVKISHCESLKRVPDMSGLTRLEVLSLRGNKAMEEVGGLSPTLRKVHIHHCDSLKKVPDMRGLTRLEELTLMDNRTMEEVGQESGHPPLQERS